jgi:hypothetical protein
MNSNLAQEILQDAARRLDDKGEGDDFSLEQCDAIANAVSKVMEGKVVARSADLDGIYNALEYACSFIKAGRKEMDSTARDQLLVAMEQIRRYSRGEPEEGGEVVQDSSITFKVDDVPIRVGNDMRVEASLPDGAMLVVVLTHEGIIMDFWPEDADEPAATSSMMYDEQAVEMTEGL